MSSLSDILRLTTASLQLSMIFRSENPLRSMLMFHKAVFVHYSKINKEVNDELDGFDMKKFGVVWFFIAVISGISITQYNKNIPIRDVVISSILISFVVTPIVSPKKVKKRLTAAVTNISIPVLILGNIFDPFLFNLDSDSMVIRVILTFALEILWLLGASRAPLFSKGRELDILSNENHIKASAFGLIVTFVISGVYVIILILNIPQYTKSRWFKLELLIITLGIITTLGYLIDNIKETAVRLLWKARVKTFANDLPKLIVKTKSGNLFFGQLYDPVDNTILILRNARLLHNNQSVEDLVDFTSNNSPTSGDYWNIPWKDIESIKIIEDGLYEPVTIDKTKDQQDLPLTIIEGWKCALDSLSKRSKKSLLEIMNRVTIMALIVTTRTTALMIVMIVITVAMLITYTSNLDITFYKNKNYIIKMSLILAIALVVVLCLKSYDKYYSKH